MLFVAADGVAGGVAVIGSDGVFGLCAVGGNRLSGQSVYCGTGRTAGNCLAGAASGRCCLCGKAGLVCKRDCY